MDVVSFLSRADSMWRSTVICAGLQCKMISKIQLIGNKKVSLFVKLNR